MQHNVEPSKRLWIHVASYNHDTDNCFTAVFGIILVLWLNFRETKPIPLQRVDILIIVRSELDHRSGCFESSQEYPVHWFRLSWNQCSSKILSPTFDNWYHERSFSERLSRPIWYVVKLKWTIHHSAGASSVAVWIRSKVHTRICFVVPLKCN